MTLAFAFVAFFAIKNSCAICLKQIIICYALSNAALILAHLKMFSGDFVVTTLAITFYYFFLNNAYCVLSARYLLVVRGNKYVMKNQKIPLDMIRSGFGPFFLMLGINCAVPIAYGVYLFVSGVNPYRGELMDPQEFKWFMGFNILNCSVQAFDGLMLVVCIVIARIQLKNYGFRRKLADSRILLIAAGSLLQVVSAVLVVLSFIPLYGSHGQDTLTNMRTTLLLMIACVYASFAQQVIFLFTVIKRISNNDAEITRTALTLT
jgi:hypothetical protein